MLHDDREKRTPAPNQSNSVLDMAASFYPEIIKYLLGLLVVVGGVIWHYIG